MAEESIALSAGQLLRRLQLTLVKDTTCPSLYWANLQERFKRIRLWGGFGLNDLQKEYDGRRLWGVFELKDS